MAETTTSTIPIRPDLPVTFAKSGAGRIALLLHGGGGPFTVQAIADHLSATMRVLMPPIPAGMARHARSGSPEWTTWPSRI